LRKLTIAAVVAVVATSLAFTGVASAHVLRYKTAKALAIKLAKQEVKENNVKTWKLGGSTRDSEHKITWGYRSTYEDGTICNSRLTVRLSGKSMDAFFHTRRCSQ
jgi:hypothetical protein